MMNPMYLVPMQSNGMQLGGVQAGKSTKMTMPDTHRQTAKIYFTEANLIKRVYLDVDPRSGAHRTMKCLNQLLQEQLLTVAGSDHPIRHVEHYDEDGEWVHFHTDLEWGEIIQRHLQLVMAGQASVMKVRVHVRESREALTIPHDEKPVGVLLKEGAILDSVPKSFDCDKCRHCQRSFFKDRLLKHERCCLKKKRKPKRKPFKVRLDETILNKSSVSSVGDLPSPNARNWRKEHDHVQGLKKKKFMKGGGMNTGNCKHCKRTFFAARIDVHEKSCAKAKNERKQFDSKRQRVPDMELYEFLKGEDEQSKREKQWRKRHEEFIVMVKSMNEKAKEKKKEKKVASQEEKKKVLAKYEEKVKSLSSLVDQFGVEATERSLLLLKYHNGDSGRVVEKLVQEFEPSKPYDIPFNPDKDLYHKEKKVAV